MDNKSLKVDRELKYSLTFFCEVLQIKAEEDDLLMRYDHYFQMYCNHFEWSHPQSKAAEQYSDVFEYFVASTFFHNHRDYAKAKLECIFSNKPDYKQLIEDYFNIELPNLD